MALAATLARRRLYYGWYIVGIAFLAQLFSSALQVHATAVFIRPMTGDLGWTRLDFQWVMSFGTVLSGFAAIPLGPAIDRYGGRTFIILGALLAGGGTMLTALVYHRWEFFLLRGLLVPLGTVGLSFVVVNVAVANWFIRKRGRAMAVAAMGASVATIALTPLSGFIINYWGWRPAWVVLGLLTWAGLIPAAALFMKRRPEDLGLLPDGRDSSQPHPTSAQAQPVEESWTLAQAMRTPTLWLLMVAFGLNMMAMSAMFFHFVPYMTGAPLNLSILTATSAVSAGGWVSFSMKLPWGFLGERFPVRYLAALSFLLMAGGILAITAARPLAAVYGAFALWGVSIGGIIPLGELAYADAFGRLHLGSIRALGMPFFVSASAAGPLVAARLYDVSGSYTKAFIIFAVLSALASLLVLLAIPPKRRPDG